MTRRLLSVVLAVVAAPSEASAPPAQLHWASSSALTPFDFGAVDAGPPRSRPRA